MYFYIAPLDYCEPVELSIRRLGYLFEIKKICISFDKV